jgi:hypothetical protein
MSDRIDSDGKGNLDDVVIENVALFHMEWMDDKTVWMRCYKTADGYSDDDVVFWLTIEKGKIVGRQGDN